MSALSITSLQEEILDVLKFSKHEIQELEFNGWAEEYERVKGEIKKEEATVEKMIRGKKVKEVDKTICTAQYRMLDQLEKMRDDDAKSIVQYKKRIICCEAILQKLKDILPLCEELDSI